MSRGPRDIMFPRALSSLKKKINKKKKKIKNGEVEIPLILITTSVISIAPE